jgi:hypothetical protein
MIVQVFFLTFLAIGVLCSAADSKKNRDIKDWGSLNINDLEKEWEGGDAEEELENEFGVFLFLCLVQIASNCYYFPSTL